MAAHVVECGACPLAKAFGAAPLLTRGACAAHSEFAINSAFVIRISSFFLLCSHCLAQIPQLFIHITRVDHCPTDFFPQNRTIPRTQTRHVNAQMCGGASESI